MPSTLTAGKHRFVRHCYNNPDPKWYFGLDLGQRRDHSALAALNLQWTAHGRCPVTFQFLFEPQLHVRYLHRFPIGISYERLYDLLKERLHQIGHTLPRKAKHLIIDAGGPGPPFVDRLRVNLANAVNIRPAFITGGRGANSLSGGYIAIPRRSIVSTLQLLMGAQSLRCPPSLPGWPILKEELLELSGDDTQPARGGAHDDLAIATGLAAWAAVNEFSELLPATDDQSQTGRQGPLF